MGVAPGAARAARRAAPSWPRCWRAIALYALATLVRGERWQRLLVDEGGTPHAASTRYALNVVGYMGNNVLPARAGDAIRVVLMAPRARHVDAHA